MTRNNDKGSRHQVSNGGDDDFVVYKWEFPEPQEKQGVTKYFVAHVVTRLRRLVVK